jgi:ribose 5-phosphate isomerase RpiB
MWMEAFWHILENSREKKHKYTRRMKTMRIALINENSQAAKNAVIENALRKVVEPMGFAVDNYGMYTAEDQAQLTYVQAGILAAVLLNSGAADYVITGCGTGEGAMLACNSFPGVICGHVEDALDAYTFAQINDGNAIAIPFAKGFGWGGDLNLEYIFEKLFCEESGQGYPKERAVPEQRNKKILDEVKKVTYRDLEDILKELDQDLVKGALSGEHFREYFFANCKCEKLAACVKEILES